MRLMAMHGIGSAEQTAFPDVVQSSAEVSQHLLLAAENVRVKWSAWGTRQTCM
jgi:hypothetical protein